MALTIGVPTRFNFGNILTRRFPITGDTSYPSGGYPFGKTQLSMILVPSHVEPTHIYDAASHVFLVFWDSVNFTLRVFGMAAAAGANTPFLEVAAATNLSAYSGFVMVYGE